jgi:hypothetical protein
MLFKYQENVSWSIFCNASYFCCRISLLVQRSAVVVGSDSAANQLLPRAEQPFIKPKLVPPWNIYRLTLPIDPAPLSRPQRAQSGSRRMIGSCQRLNQPSQNSIHINGHFLLCSSKNSCMAVKILFCSRPKVSSNQTRPHQS